MDQTGPEHDGRLPRVNPHTSLHPVSLGDRVKPWIQAARPAAHPMIFLPLVVGQSLAFHVHGRFNLAFFLYSFSFGVLYQVFLLYLNDRADEAVDRASQQHWLSGGSRVVPQGKLRGSDLLAGARVALIAMAGLSLFSAFFVDRPGFPAGVVLAIVLCWAYNLPPLQLSYRGHGEVLQGLGCGVLLPLLGFYMQLGSLQGFPWSVLISLYLLFHAGNIITALPDFISDKQGLKKTFPVRRGQRRARTTALFLLALAYLGFAFSKHNLAPSALAIIVLPSGLALVAVAMLGYLRTADVAQFANCKKFVALTSLSQAWFLCALAATLLLDGLS